MQNILIVKHGALGDVVRTSYFCSQIKLRSLHENAKIWWLTSTKSAPLLSHHPFIDHIITDASAIENISFDTIYSLDDEADIVDRLQHLKARRVVGLRRHDGKLVYCAKSAMWFDMGIRSHLGKQRADELKKLNTKTHKEIFSAIFDVNPSLIRPAYYLSAAGIQMKRDMQSQQGLRIGINPYAGGRWPSKELCNDELVSLVLQLLTWHNSLNLFLFGGGDDFERNERAIELVSRSSDHAGRIFAVKTDADVHLLAGAVGGMHAMISSDSFALHLAISAGVETVAFFTATSAAEIDDFGIVRKVISQSPDYCSYRADADNTGITASRIIDEVKNLHSIHSFERDIG